MSARLPRRTSYPKCDPQTTFLTPIRGPAERIESPSTLAIRPDPKPLPPHAIKVDGEPFDLVEYTDQHLAGIGRTRRRVIDFVPPGDVLGRTVIARVVTYPQGPRCFCMGPDDPQDECKHILALVRTGRIPEIAFLETCTANERGEP